MDTRRVVGCMTGTSIDALDVALVQISGRGLAMTSKVLATHAAPLGDLAPRLRALAEQEPMSAGEIARLAREFSLLHAKTIRELVAEHAGAPAPIDLVCVHGQTVYHAPPVSWQLINAPVIAHEVNAPVVYDLRAADLAAGGQGAPITPIADWVLFRSPNATAVVNLGGFCNVTMLPGGEGGAGPEAVEGFDVCACNLLLDAVARASLGRKYDEDGREASAGRVAPQALNELAALLTAQAKARRSLGTGDELFQWIDRYKPRVEGRDLAASACHAIARCIIGRTGDAPRLLLAGGGAHNRALVGAIASLTKEPVQTLDAIGVSPSHREAACFAVLGALCQDKVPITLRQVTRTPVVAPLAGCWAGLPG